MQSSMDMHQAAICLSVRGYETGLVVSCGRPKVFLIAACLKEYAEVAAALNAHGEHPCSPLHSWLTVSATHAPSDLVVPPPYQQNMLKRA